MSIAGKVREYLRNKPYMVKALEKNFASYARLSDIIIDDLKYVRNETMQNTVKVTLRRYSEKLRIEAKSREKRALSVLRGSRIATRGGVKTVISKRAIKLDPESMILRFKYEGSNVYVVDEDEKIPEKDLLSSCKKCGLLIIHSPPKVETTPGVVAYLTSVIAEHNINLIEFVSCHTKTILVVKKDDILRAYEVLSSLIGS